MLPALSKPLAITIVAFCGNFKIPTPDYTATVLALLAAPLQHGALAQTDLRSKHVSALLKVIQLLHKSALLMV